MDVNSLTRGAYYLDTYQTPVKGGGKEHERLKEELEALRLAVEALDAAHGDALVDLILQCFTSGVTSRK